MLFEQRIVILVYKSTQTPIQIGIRALATLLKMIVIRFRITYNEEREKKYEIEINSHHNWFNGSNTDVALKSIRLRSVWLNGNGHTPSKNRMIFNSLALIMRLQNASNWKFSCTVNDVAFWLQPNGRNRVCYSELDRERCGKKGLRRKEKDSLEMALDSVDWVLVVTINSLVCVLSYTDTGFFSLLPIDSVNKIINLSTNLLSV